MQNTQTQFWNSAYAGGMKYRQFENDNIINFIKHKHIHGDVLDIGCGAGEFAIDLALNGLHVTAIDISDIAISKAKTNAKKANVNVNFYIGDIDPIYKEYEEQDFKNKFDTITCKLVYAFIEDKISFVNKIKSLLRDNLKM